MQKQDSVQTNSARPAVTNESVPHPRMPTDETVASGPQISVGVKQVESQFQGSLVSGPTWTESPAKPG